MKLKKKQLKEAKRFTEYFISGGVWFWSGYLIIVFSYEHIGLFWANFIGNAVGITLNFLLERYWVFKTKSPTKLFIATQRYIIYTALNAFLLNFLILRLLQNVGIEPAIGQFIASAFFTFWNYFWYKAWVFRGLEKNKIRTKRKVHKNVKPKMVRHHP
ncbi:GtrA family protein [Candidatus Saccharibacteria bacterium]|nr:GtrA family protein [Candidatus Saccharibacteria bacterium]